MINLPRGYIQTSGVMKMSKWGKALGAGLLSAGAYGKAEKAKEETIAYQEQRDQAELLRQQNMARFSHDLSMERYDIQKEDKAGLLSADQTRQDALRIEGREYHERQVEKERIHQTEKGKIKGEKIDKADNIKRLDELRATIFNVLNPGIDDVGMNIAVDETRATMLIDEYNIVARKLGRPEMKFEGGKMVDPLRQAEDQKGQETEFDILSYKEQKAYLTKVKKINITVCNDRIKRLKTKPEDDKKSWHYVKPSDHPGKAKEDDPLEAAATGIVGGIKKTPGLIGRFIHRPMGSDFRK